METKRMRSNRSTDEEREGGFDAFVGDQLPGLLAYAHALTGDPGMAEQLAVPAPVRGLRGGV